jgi:hypothetical protein
VKRIWLQQKHIRISMVTTINIITGLTAMCKPWPSSESLSILLYSMLQAWRSMVTTVKTITGLSALCEPWPSSRSVRLFFLQCFSDLAVYTLPRDHLGGNIWHFLYFVNMCLSARCVSTGPHATYLVPTIVNFNAYYRQYFHLM